jgi:hypothetical protein
MSRSVRAAGLLFALGLALLGDRIGNADGLTQSVKSVAAAVVSTPRCASTGPVVTPNLSGANVVSVTVGSIPSACGGASLQVAVNNGAASGTGSATVPAGGGSVTVTLATAVGATAAEEIDLVLVGP